MTVGECLHCRAAIEGDERYCCSGCELAYDIIHRAQAAGYYEQRERPGPRPQPASRTLGLTGVHALSESRLEARFGIGGMRCASCVWVVEQVVSQLDGVEHVHVSYASGVCRLRWRPSLIDDVEIAQTIERLGYVVRPAESVDQSDRDLLSRFGLAVFCMCNVMMLSLSLYIGWWTGMEERFVALFAWINLALTTPVVLWSAQPFFSAAFQGLKHRVLHMDVPISIAIGTIYLHGVHATLYGHDSWLDSLTMLVALLLGGRWLEARGRKHVAEAATALAASVPAEARRVEGDQVEWVRVESLQVGERVEVSAGEEIPVDASVEEGFAWVRSALITGESRPIEVSVGDEVSAGTSIIEGHLRLRVRCVGDESLVARMAEAVRGAVDEPVVSPLDWIAPWFTVFTLGAATLTFLYVGTQGGWSEGFNRSLAVLVVACPCALSLSYPVTTAAGVGAVARRGVLVRGGASLLRLANVQVVALDKTGTVTTGQLKVSADRAVLRVAAGLERVSAHPIARSIVGEAIHQRIPLPKATSLKETVGEGVSGVIDGQHYSLGAGEPGQLLLRSQGEVVGTIDLDDTLRADGVDAIQALSAGARVVMLTGDSVDVAEQIAQKAGITEVHAAMKPLEKERWIASEQALGRHVLFVGDGLNDGPAIGRADVGVAMGTGAISSVLIADAVILDGSLLGLSRGIAAGRCVRRIVRQNLWLSVIYNVSAVVAAMCGWVNPLVAAVLMPLSSLWVLASALGVERELQREDG